MLVWSQAVKDVAPLKTSTKACWKMVFYYIGYYRRKITNAHDCTTENIDAAHSGDFSIAGPD